MPMMCLAIPFAWIVERVVRCTHPFFKILSTAMVSLVHSAGKLISSRIGCCLTKRARHWRPPVLEDMPEIESVKAKQMVELEPVRSMKVHHSYCSRLNAERSGPLSGRVPFAATPDRLKCVVVRSMTNDEPKMTYGTMRGTIAAWQMRWGYKYPTTKDN